MKTKISVSRQALVDGHIDWQAHRIENLNDPVQDMDAVNKRSLVSYVDEVVGSGSNPVAIGPAEDGAYTDGLFTDFEPATPIGTAVDRFNEVLRSLSPKPAPGLSSASCSSNGVSGKLSFGASNVIPGYTNVPGVDVNGAFTVAGTQRGIFNASQNISGTLANNVSPNYVNNRPYPNNAFGDGDQGTLHLVVNDTVVHSVDLNSFTSGNSLNTNNSGFNLSAATPVQFDNGDSFEVFKYRTGTWVVSSSDQRAGYNSARVRHEFAPGQFRDTQLFTWVVDTSTTGSNFENLSLDNLSMTGLRHLSGVKFHTAGTAKFNVDIYNAYKNTYSSSPTALNFTGTNVLVSDDPIPPTETEDDIVSVLGKTVTINQSRLLNASIGCSVSVDRTVQPDLASSEATIPGILLDSTADNSTTGVIRFNGEGRRIHAGLDVESTSYGSGVAGSQPAVWDSTQSLVGSDPHHNTGLQVYNGRLQYPVNLDFSVFAANGPSDNVDYRAASGNRTFIGFFYNANAYSNFRLNVTGSNANFVPVSVGPSGNNLTLEILAPNTTVDENGNVEWKDAASPHTGIDTDSGCYASTYGNSIPTNWGCTIGTKNTSTSGGVIVVRVTASEDWEGYLTSIGLTWL